MARAFFRIALSCLVLAADVATAAELTVHALAGRSVQTWHGQAEIRSLNLERPRPLTRAIESGVVFSLVDVRQPKSWYGDRYGDGNENVRALGAAAFVRRRFNFDSERLHWYVEASTGPMWAEKRVPAATSRFNFATTAGVGVVVQPRARWPLLAGYRFLHISNGGYSPRNPGLNVSSLVVGVQMRR